MDMRTGRSVNLPGRLWGAIGKVAEDECGGVVGYAIEKLCFEALKHREVEA